MEATVVRPRSPTFFAISLRVVFSLISFSIAVKKSLVATSWSSEIQASFSIVGPLRTMINAGRAYWLTVLCAPTRLHSSNFTAESALFLSLRDSFEEGLHTQGRLPSASFPDKWHDARKLSARAVFVVMHRILNQAREPGVSTSLVTRSAPTFLMWRPNHFVTWSCSKCVALEVLSVKVATAPEIQAQALSVLLVPPCLCFGLRGRCFVVKHLTESSTTRAFDNSW